VLPPLLSYESKVILKLIIGKYTYYKGCVASKNREAFRQTSYSLEKIRYNFRFDIHEDIPENEFQAFKVSSECYINDIETYLESQVYLSKGIRNVGFNHELVLYFDNFVLFIYHDGYYRRIFPVFWET